MGARPVSHRTTSASLAATLVLAVLVTGRLAAQGGYEYEVYGSETVLPGFFMVELHSNYTVLGQSLIPTSTNAPVFDNLQRGARTGQLLEDPTCHNGSGPFADVTPIRTAVRARPGPLAAPDSVGCGPVIPESTAHTAHETIEVSAGLNSWSEVGFYAFSVRPPGSTLHLSGGSARIKVRAPLTWRWPVGVALSTEVEHEDAAYSADTWSWEIRPVIDRAAGRWYVSLNPTLERTLRGPGTTLGLQFSPSGTMSYDATRVLTAGVEYYGAYGKIDALAPAASQLQQFFGIVDLHTSPVWEINAGVGVGVTSATSRLVGKFVVGRRFPW